MMNTLNITWNFGKGRMQILLDKFFPSTKKDLKQLLKIISLDWEHETELKENLKVYFQEQKTVHEAAKKKKRAQRNISSSGRGKQTQRKWSQQRSVPTVSLFQRMN